MNRDKKAQSIKKEIVDVGIAMKKAGLPAPFIVSAIDAAFEFEGVYDLLILWKEETDPNERDAIIADIQEMVDECNQ